MGGHRFDEIVRAAVAGASRRQVLRALAAGIVGGLTFGARSGRIAAQDAEGFGATSCAQDGDCAHGDGCTGGRCDNGLCTLFVVHCVAGYVCCGNAECCPGTNADHCQTDADCDDGDGDPCTGARCENGACTYAIASCAPGFVCCGNGECCPERVVPGPEECKVAPRSVESLRALTMIPHPHVPPSVAGSASARVSGSTPAEARPVDAAMLAGITATAREVVACLNAGDVRRRLALYSDHGLVRFVAVYGPPQVELAGGIVTPTLLPVDQRVAFLGLREGRLLPDGRVTATVIQDAPTDPRAEEPWRAVFVAAGDRWLIDDVFRGADDRPGR